MPLQVDFEDQLKRSGCLEDFEKMEGCLGENDRDWRTCQDYVKVFKLCMKDKAINVSADVSDNKK